MLLSRKKVFCLIILLFCSPIYLYAEEAKITGIYSSLRFNEESGDLLGAELFLVYTKSGYQATLQIAEGGPGNLLLVDVAIKGSKIIFTIPNGIYAGTFQGKIKGSKLIGILMFSEGGKSKLVLPRKEKSYWQ